MANRLYVFLFEGVESGTSSKRMLITLICGTYRWLSFFLSLFFFHSARLHLCNKRGNWSENIINVPVITFQHQQAYFAQFVILDVGPDGSTHNCIVAFSCIKLRAPSWSTRHTPSHASVEGRLTVRQCSQAFYPAAVVPQSPYSKAPPVLIEQGLHNRNLMCCFFV